MYLCITHYPKDAFCLADHKLFCFFFIFVQFILFVVPITSFATAGAVFLCLESVMAIAIVLMAVMNKAVQKRKAMVWHVQHCIGLPWWP